MQWRLGALAVLWALPCGGPVLAQERGGGTTATFLPASDVEALLPQSSVYAIVEDLQGYLWFGTREGVVRWDGYETRTWKHDPFDDASLPGNVIFDLVQDRTGDLWATTYNYQQSGVGVARIIAPAYDEVERYPFPGALLLLDPEKRIVLATGDSLHTFDPEERRFRAVSQRPAGDESAGDLDPENSVLLAAGGAHLELCDLNRTRCGTIPTDSMTIASLVGSNQPGPVSIAADGTIWVGTEEGLARVDEERTLIELVYPWSQVGTEGIVVDIVEDSEGNLWVLSGDGVRRIDALDGEVEYHALLTLGDGTRNLAPIDLHVDRSGTVWVGTVWGLYRYRPGEASFRHMQHDPNDPNSLGSGLVVSLHEDRDGFIWIGTIGGGLNRYDPRSGEVRRYRRDGRDPTSLAHDIVWVVSSDAMGRVWAGGPNGLSRYDPISDGFETFRPDDTVPAVALDRSINTIQALALGVEGEFLIPCFQDCRSSLITFDPIEGTFEFPSVLDPHTLGYMAIDRSNRLWVATERGLMRLDLETQTIDSLRGPATERSFDGILTFHLDERESLWIGTNSGLFHLSPDGRLLSQYTDAEGLPSSTVYGILEDERGTIWVSTNRGLASIDPGRPPSEGVRVYDHTTGLQNVEYNRQAFLETRDGTMYFGGDRGVTVFDPDAVGVNPYRPPIVLTAVQRSGIDGTAETPYATGAEVVIAPGDDTFTLEFAALNYVNPHRNQYRFMLDGFDRDWGEAGTERMATYTNVPPGRYTFRVRGSNDDGVWSEEELAIPIRVAPWFWETWWFQLAIVMGLAGVIAYMTWYVSRSRYRAELLTLRAQRTIDRERSRISRDMHDEVGASLTEIAILSELAKRDGPKQSDSSFIDRIADKSRDTLDAIGEIIWAVDPKNDAGNRFLPYLREYASEYLENAGPAAKLDFPSPDTPIRVTADFRRHVFLILKETLTNVAKHADADRVEVTLEIADDTLRLRVRDDGRGFETNDPSGGHGLLNLRQRAEEISGRVEVRSTVGSGTDIVLEAPLPTEIHEAPVRG